MSDQISRGRLPRRPCLILLRKMFGAICISRRDGAQFGGPNGSGPPLGGQVCRQGSQEGRTGDQEGRPRRPTCPLTPACCPPSGRSSTAVHTTWPPPVGGIEHRSVSIRIMMRSNHFRNRAPSGSPRLGSADLWKTSACTSVEYGASMGMLWGEHGEHGASRSLAWGE